MAKKVSIDKTMQDIVHIKNQIDGLTMLLNNKKSLMAKYFEKSGTRTAENDDCTVYVAERTKVNYDIEAILEKLPKDKTSQFVVNTRTISNWPYFVKLMKRNGVTMAQLRPCITTKREVDQKALDKLYEKGKLELRDLEGCYDATVSKSIVLKMKDTERSIPISDAK